MHAFPSYALRLHIRVNRLALWGWGKIGPGWIGGSVEFSFTNLRIVLPGTAWVPGCDGGRCAVCWCPLWVALLRLGWVLVLRLFGSVGGELLSFGVGRWFRPLFSLELDDWLFGEFLFRLLSVVLLSG